MEKSKEKKEKNKSFLRKVAFFLYLLAFISLIVGICKMASHFSSVTERMFDYDDFEEFDDFFSDGKLQSAISSFFSAFVLFIWGSVFMFISNSKLIKQKLEKKQEEQKQAEEKEQELPQVKEVPKKRYFCAYCDNELDENDRKCPYCGSSKKIQK